MTATEAILVAIAIVIPLAAVVALGLPEAGVGAVVAVVTGMAIDYFFPVGPLTALIIAELAVYLGIWFLDADLLTPSP